MSSEKTCAVCANPFGCGADAPGCWCESLPALEKIEPERGCLCRACLEQALKEQSAPGPRS